MKFLIILNSKEKLNENYIRNSTIDEKLWVKKNNVNSKELDKFF